jgi:PBP1b-binding outer membrane lipoprotein LpoB
MKKLSILLIALMLAGCAGQTKMVKTNKGMMSKKQKKELKQNQKKYGKIF